MWRQNHLSRTKVHLCVTGGETFLWIVTSNPLCVPALLIRPARCPKQVAGRNEGAQWIFWAHVSHALLLSWIRPHPVPPLRPICLNHSLDAVPAHAYRLDTPLQRAPPVCYPESVMGGLAAHSDSNRKFCNQSRRTWYSTFCDLGTTIL